MNQVRVKIVGDHPWSGYIGTAISVETPSIGILPPMVRVRLDAGQQVPDGHECFATKEQLMPLAVLDGSARTRGE